MTDQYRYYKNIIIKQVDRLNNIDLLKEIINYCNANINNANTMGLYRSAIKSLWWETHKYNKYNYADLEWELMSLKKISKQRGHKRGLSESEYGDLLLVCTSARDRLIIMFLAETGCRVSEMVNIKLSSFRVRKSYMCATYKSGKTGLSVNIAILKLLYDEIRNEFAGIEYLFETANHTKVNRNYISGRIKKHGLKIGVNISAHTLRHYFITEKINEGQNIIDIASAVGHKNIGSTVENYYTG